MIVTPPNGNKSIFDQNYSMAVSRRIQFSDVGPGPRRCIQTKNRAKVTASVKSTKVVETVTIKDHSIIEETVSDRWFFNVTPIAVFEFFRFLCCRDHMTPPRPEQLKSNDQLSYDIEGLTI